MAQKYRVRPADYLGIEDPSIAFYFDVECTEALIEHDYEMEKSRLEAMSLGGLSGALGSPKVTVDRSDKPIPLNA